jgi:cobalt-zinc-cadmium efflux system membrane fusion protein
MSTEPLLARIEKNNNFVAFIIAAAILFLALALWGCGAGKGEAVAAAAAAAPRVDGDAIQFDAGSPQLASFRVEAAVEEGAAPMTVTGRLAWNEDATVRIVPPVAGRIVTLSASAGQRVARDAVLAELSSPDFGQAQADAARAAADLAAAERTRDRIARLYERGAAPRKDLDGAETDLARARAEARRTEARLTKWGGSASSGPDQLYRVTSPLTGTIVERNANPGQESRPDAALPLFVVSEPTRLWILLDVTERDLSGVAAGDRLAIRSAAYPGRIFLGRLGVVGDSLDPATRTVKARGVVENPHGLLKAEMYVTVEVTGAATAPVSVVPARAVLIDGARRFCFVEEEPGRFRKRTVEVGIERAGRVPVVSGLAPRARVVTDGSLLLASLFAQTKS